MSNEKIRAPHEYIERCRYAPATALLPGRSGNARCTTVRSAVKRMFLRRNSPEQELPIAPAIS